MRERERCISLSTPLPFKEEFSLYQKLWDSLNYGEKVDKSDTKYLSCVSVKILICNDF